MPSIQELSPHLADLIAAGEVVERPASVAKELIENAIDAGASRITVEIQNGGISYLRITDDGCGMSREDAPIAFRRHATSKLRTEEDLSAIGTLGFRGEALAAISAVSRIDLFTKQKGTLAGVHLMVEAGDILEQSEAGCPDGTSFIVRDLFFNTPARMKFLKKDFTEANYVLSVVQHAALSHPEIAFSLTRDGSRVFNSSGNGKLVSPVLAVYGYDIFENMMEVPSFSKDGCTVWGYVGKPHAGRTNRSMQNFFVNGRYVQSRMMQVAVEEAYRNKIIIGKFPICIIFLTLPLNMVDVNVHPTKTEVKFAQDKKVFDAVYGAVCAAIDSNNNTPVLHVTEKTARKPSEDNLTAEQQRISVPASPAAEVSVPSTAADKAQVPAEPPEEKKAAPVPEQKKLNPDPDIADRDPNYIYDALGFHAPIKKVTQEEINELIAKTRREIEEEKRQAALEPPKPPEPMKSLQLLDDFLGSFTRHYPTERELKELKLGRRRKRRLFRQEIDQIKCGEATPHALDTVYTDPIDPEKLLQEALEAEEKANQPEPAEEMFPSSKARVIGEVFNTYLIVEDEEGILLIDKHAAHERIIFNKLHDTTTMVQQALLSSIVVELTANEFDAIYQNLDQVRSIGFEIDVFGATSFFVRSIPAYLDVADTQNTIAEIADKLLNNRSPVPDRLDDLIHTVSCKAAIKAGKSSNPAEMQKLCDQVLNNPDIKCCPHGRPVSVRLSKYEIDKMFKRVNQ